MHTDTQKFVSVLENLWRKGSSQTRSKKKAVDLFWILFMK